MMRLVNHKHATPLPTRLVIEKYGVEGVGRSVEGEFWHETSRCGVKVIDVTQTGQVIMTDAVA